MDRIVILSGAGMSAESGIKTFRDADGLWEGHDVMQVASPIGWRKDQDLVLDFYNQRRRQLLQVEPNAGHRAIVKLEEQFDVHIVTQNIDDLHERAGSSKVLHLHGELLVARSTADPSLLYQWEKDILPGDVCEKGSQLRPHVVWFGEPVPNMESAARLVGTADLVIIIGTSMQVYPAASLVHYARSDAGIFYVDPRPNIEGDLARLRRVQIMSEKAGTGVPKLVNQLLGGEHS